MWLRARLNAAGQRPISNVVDITNYVMLALGNPLHAFDFPKLAGGQIVVRRAAAGERLRTLDSVDRELIADDLLIADAERGVALAGIMGGEETEIGDATTTVLLEAANFEPHGIYRSSERQRLRTEGSNRWEKGVDPYLAGHGGRPRDAAHARARGRHAGRRTPTCTPSCPCAPVVHYRPERADALIGVETPPERQYALLGRLGFDRDGEQRRRPDLARTRRDARGRRDRGDRALPARGRAEHAAGAARDVRPADARAGAPAARRGHARRPRLRRDVHAEPAARTTTRRGSCPSRSRSS